MQCPSCGTEIQPGVPRCPSCGAPTAPTTPTPSETSDTNAYNAGIEPVPYIAGSPLTGSSAISPVSTSSATTPPPRPKASDDEVPPAQPQQAGEEKPPQRPRMLRSTALLLIMLALLIFVGGGGFTTYATIFHALELHNQATVVAQSIFTGQTQATVAAQANAPQNAYDRLTATNPAFSDPLDGLHASPWSNKGKGETGCAFTNGAYHVRISPKDFYSYCLAAGNSYRNFLFQVQMTVIKGLDGGIVFRTADPSFPGYIFTITESGLYTLNVSFDPQHGRTLAFGRSSAINTGLNSTNLLGVLASSDTISLFINKRFVTSVSDASHPSGAIGMIASNLPQTSIDVAFTNANVWKLP